MTQVLLMAGIGVMLILVDLEERIGLSGFGAAALGGALLLYRLDVRVPSAEEREARVRRTPEGLEIGLRNTLPEVRVGFPLVGSVTCFHLAWLLSYDPSWRYGSIAVGGALLLLIPDGIRGLVRGGHLRITAQGLDYHGWNAELSLSWEAMAMAYCGPSTQRNAAVVLILKPGTTLRVRRRFLVLPIDYAAWGGRHRREVRIASASLDQPGPVAALAAMLIEYPARCRGTVIDIWVHQRRSCPTDRFDQQFRTAVHSSLPPWDYLL